MTEHIEIKKVADLVRLAYQRFMTITEPVDEDSGQEGDLRIAGGYADMKSTDIIEEKEW
jgi:hypothetical protein